MSKGLIAMLMLLIVGLAVSVDTAWADLFKCKTDDGAIEYRDFPCAASSRPSQPSPPAAADRQPERRSVPGATSASSMPRNVGFASLETYQQARQVCLALLSQYYSLTELQSCAIDDMACIRRANDAMRGSYERLVSVPAWKSNQCELVMEMERQTGAQGKRFEVVATANGCKYFVVEQRSSYSLAEDWLCFTPDRGDVGFGDVSSSGIKEVKLNNTRCSLYIDEWLLGKSQALEKMAQKCDR